MRRALASALLGTLCALLAGCVSVSEGVGSLSEVGADAVLLVGRIEVVPPVKPEEQRYKAGVDLFDTKRHFIGRAILFMSDKPEFQERTDVALNPPLEETFFLRLPADRPYVAKGSVTMELVARAVSARQSVMDRAELLFPAPLAIDVRAGDRAVYIGTLRLHRDEFHEVTKVELLDHYAAAAVEFHRKFPGSLPPRKALLRGLRK
jgi:hypothetical protein